jgi:hypothetical protein
MGQIGWIARMGGNRMASVLSCAANTPPAQADHG